MTKIKSIKHLKELSKGNDIECFISLNGGIRSSKDIYFNDKKFEIRNCIDDTQQELTEKELHTESNIGEAIDKGAFYIY